MTKNMCEKGASQKCQKRKKAVCARMVLNFTVRCAFSRNIRDLIFLYINTFIEIFFICHNRKVKTTLEFINQFRFLTIGRKTRAVKSKVLFRNL